MTAPKRPRSWFSNLRGRGAAPRGEYGNISPEGRDGRLIMSPRALLYRRPSEPQAIQIVFDQAIYLVRIRRHRQARRYTLRIHAATREVILTMPPRGSLREAKEFAQRHGGWIAARLHRLPQAAPFAHGAIVPLRGVEHRIAHRSGVRGTVWIESAEGGEPLLCVAGEAPHLDRRVNDFLRREAQRDLEIASRRAAEMLGVTIGRISVRDQSSRWGSCSTTGVLSYSWRLILAPTYVLEYLTVHEVAHLVEMNHSARFWRLVHRVCPDAGRAKVWLDLHGTDLHRYGLPSEAVQPRVPAAD
jgi:predicted metal-dependent hydrolase